MPKWGWDSIRVVKSISSRQKRDFLRKLKSSSSPTAFSALHHCHVAEYRWLDFIKLSFTTFLYSNDFLLITLFAKNNWQENQIKRTRKFFLRAYKRSWEFARVRERKKKVDKRTDKIIFMWFSRGTKRKVIENICLSHKKKLLHSTIGFPPFITFLLERREKKAREGLGGDIDFALFFLQLSLISEGSSTNFHKKGEIKYA